VGARDFFPSKFINSLLVATAFVRFIVQTPPSWVHVVYETLTSSCEECGNELAHGKWSLLRVIKNNGSLCEVITTLSATRITFLWCFVGVWHSGITWYNIMWWCHWTFSSVYLWNYGYSYVLTFVLYVNQRCCCIMLTGMTQTLQVQHSLAVLDNWDQCDHHGSQNLFSIWNISDSSILWHTSYINMHQKA
jgi:hypothetical protein